MRIDFALASPALAARVTGASIDREERKGKAAVRPRPGDRRAGATRDDRRPVRILVLEHDPSDPLLRLGDWLTEAGAELTVCRPHAGDAIPPST